GHVDTQTGPDHGHHRAGRLVPGGAAARQGVRGARHRPPEQLVQHGPDRAPVPGPARDRGQDVPALRGPGRRDGAAGDHHPGEAGRGVQPRRAVARAGQLRPAGVHGAGRRAGDDQPAGGGPGRGRRQAAGPGVPGEQQRDVREGAGDAADRADAVPPAEPVRVREGVQLLADRELPRGVRDVRGERDPVQPREPAAGRDVRHPQDHPGGHPDQGGAAGQAVPREPGRQAGLGVRRRLRRGDVADAPADEAGRLRDRDRRDAQRPRVPRRRVRPARAGLAEVRRGRPEVLPPGRGRPAARRRRQGQEGTGLDAEGDVQGVGRDDGQGRPGAGPAGAGGGRERGEEGRGPAV
ncbi:MAG: GDP-mannose 4,6-dehydratase, partial [uncultured Phycisphaerae bacterium]